MTLHGVEPHRFSAIVTAAVLLAAGCTSQPAAAQRSTSTNHSVTVTGDVFFDLRTGIATPLPRSITSIGSSTSFRGTSSYQASPDAGRLAFEAPVDGRLQVFVARVDGSHVRQITRAAHDARNPDWSPAGTRLVFECRGKVYVTSLRSGRTVKVTRLSGSLVRPSFSPNGRRVIFTRITRMGMSLWTAPSTGGRSSLLLQKAAYGSFSPDGRTIAYHYVGRAVDPGNIWPFDLAIRVVRADGTRSRRLIGPWIHEMAPIDWSSQRPDWSPDGRRIAREAIGLSRVVSFPSGAAGTRLHAVEPSWLNNHILILASYDP